MKLSDGEKLILVMLSEIHEHLEIQGEVDSTFIREAIGRGQSWALSDQYAGVLSREDVSEEVLRETQRIMDMWRHLETSYAELSDEDKARVKVEADPFGNDVVFAGFDGNSGEGHLGAAHFMVTQMGWYPERNGAVPNSHSRASIEVDRRMLPAFSRAIQATHGRHLNADQLIQILNEQTHPDYRK